MSASLAQMRHLRKLEGDLPEITDDWLVVVGDPDGRGKAYALTIAELRAILLKSEGQ